MAIKKYPSQLLGQEVWGYDTRIHGKRYRKLGFSSKQAAETALFNKRVEANEVRAGVRAPHAPVMVKAVVEARIRQLGEEKYSRKNSARVLRAWLDLLPSDLKLHELTIADITRYRDARLFEVKPQTVFREITDIMSCLSLARETFPGLDTWSPPRRPKLKVPKGNRQVVITLEQIKRMLDDLRRPKEEVEQWREYRARLDAADFFQIALQTAGRKSEIRTLRWLDVYWQSKRLKLDSTKTGEEGVIEIPDSLVELLHRRREEQQPPSPYVFPSDITPTRPVARFRTETLRTAAERCEIPWGYNEPNGIVLHTTRHTAVTAMLEAGYDLATVQAQSRHSTRQMLMRYAHASARSKRQAAGALDQFNTSVPLEQREGMAGAGGRR
jgi:integrase